MRVKLTERWVYAIALLNIIIVIFRLGVCLQTDTESYIQAWEQSLAQGRLDLLRTPLYPLFIGFCQQVAGVYFGWVCVALQHLVFLLSIHYFRQVASMALSSGHKAHSSEQVVLWLTLCYAIFPVTSVWGSILLTESFAVSGVVFFAYHMLSYTCCHRASSAIWSAVFMLLLILLRPFFVYLIPIALLFWLFMLKARRPGALMGCVAVLLVGLSQLAYCYQFQRQFGLFAHSSVSTVNSAYLGFQDGLMRPEFTTNGDYQAFIQEHNGTSDPWPVCLDAMERFGCLEVNRSVKASMHALPMEWADHALSRLGTVSHARYNVSYVVSNPISSVFRFSVMFLFIFLVCYAIGMVYFWLRHRRVPYASLLLWLIVAGCVATSVIAAQSDWGRLTAPSFPLFLCMLGNCIKMQR